MHKTGTKPGKVKLHASSLILLTLVFFVLFPAVSPATSQHKSVFFKQQQGIPPSLPALLFKLRYSPDFMEIPLVLSKDNVAIVFNDIYLDTTTNIAELFPERKRQDGRYYVIDFTWLELQQLSFTYMINEHEVVGHPARFSDAAALLQYPANNHSSTTTLVPTILFPRFHQAEKRDISTFILKQSIALFETEKTPLYLQCYDPEEIRRIHEQLLVGLPVNVSLILGVSETTDNQHQVESYSYDLLFTRSGIRLLSRYLHGILLFTPQNNDRQTLLRFIDDCHALDVQVFLGISSFTGDDGAERIQELLYVMNSDGIISTQLLSQEDLKQQPRVTEETASDPHPQPATGEQPVRY